MKTFKITLYGRHEVSGVEAVAHETVGEEQLEKRFHELSHFLGKRLPSSSAGLVIVYDIGYEEAK